MLSKLKKWIDQNTCLLVKTNWRILNFIATSDPLPCQRADSMDIKYVNLEDKHPHYYLIKVSNLAFAIKHRGVFIF